jgi:hemerythrin-like metal-binding protein
MELSYWNEELRLGNPALDSAHRFLYGALQRLADAPPSKFAAAYYACVAALERDFRREEAMMERMNYEGLRCHREQHARALSGLHHAAAALAQGDPRPARHSIELLDGWLRVHITTLDQALAAAWVLSRHGKVPLP